MSIKKETRMDSGKNPNSLDRFSSFMTEVEALRPSLLGLDSFRGLKVEIERFRSFMAERKP